MPWLRTIVDNFMQKSAFDDSLTVKFPQGVTQTQQLLQPFMSQDPAQIDSRKRYQFKQLTESPDTAIVLNQNPNNKINANTLENVLRLLVDNNVQTGTLRTELQNRATQEQKRMTQTIENRYNQRLKVVFTLLAETTDLTVFGLQWTPPMINGTIQSLFLSKPNTRWPQGNVIKQEIEALGITLEKSQEIAGGMNLWKAFGVSPKIPQLKTIFEQHGYDTSAISTYQQQKETGELQTKNVQVTAGLQFQNISDLSDYHIGLTIKDNFNSRQEADIFIEIVESQFPIAGKKSIPPQENMSARAKLLDQRGQRFYDKRSDTIFLKGTYNIYQDFQLLLNMKGFDTRSLRPIIQQLQRRRDFQSISIVNGQLDGYYVRNETREGEGIAKLLSFNIGIEHPNDWTAVRAAAVALVGDPPKREAPRSGWRINEAEFDKMEEFYGIDLRPHIEEIKEATDFYEKQLKRKKVQTDRMGRRKSYDATFYHDALQYKVQKPGQEPYQLYPLQIEGAKWLYTRQSALLGDETGVGKTEQLIVAADLRTKNEGQHPLLAFEEGPDGIQKDENGYPITKPAVRSDGQPMIENITNGSNIPAASGKILIFTLASVVNQFKERIMQITGATENMIATSVEEMMQNPDAKWLVLSYGAVNRNTAKQQANLEEAEGEQQPDDATDVTEKGNNIAKIRARMEFINSMNFDVMILDECHKVKNSTSATAKNIAIMGQNIPFKWGASATVSANKPSELHHQLKTVGHPLGHITPNTFKRKFTGTSVEDIAGRQSEIDPTNAKAFLRLLRESVPQFDKLDVDRKKEYAINFAETEPLDDGRTLQQKMKDQIRNVTNLHSTLILTDVYQQKSKKQVNPNLPEHHRVVGFPGITGSNGLIQTTPEMKREIDNDVTQNWLAELENEEQPNPMKKLMAYRQAMAMAKIPYTIAAAKQILNAGQKVLIFTAFKAPARELGEKLNLILNPMGQQAYVTMGGGSVARKERQINEFADLNSNIRAYVLGVESSGTGLDLPNIVEHVIVNDISWTPKDADQVEGRAFRVNSKKPVSTHYMVLQGTLDHVIYNTVQKKRDIADRVQKIDEQYADKIRQNQPVTTELNASQTNHWELVKEQLKTQIEVDDWVQQTQQTQQTYASNWLRKQHFRSPAKISA